MLEALVGWRSDELLSLGIFPTYAPLTPKSIPSSSLRACRPRAARAPPGDRRTPNRHARRRPRTAADRVARQSVSTPPLPGATQPGQSADGFLMMEHPKGTRLEPGAGGSCRFVPQVDLVA